MKNKEFSFSDPHLAKKLGQFLNEADKRFDTLDVFNADCKMLTRLLNKFAVPDLDWVNVETTASVMYSLAWHNGTIVWTSDESGEAELPCDAQALYEAPASIRWAIKEAIVLPFLLEAATARIKMK